MKHEFLSIAIDGTEASDLYDDLVSIEVELDDELAGMVRLRLAMPRRPDGSWPYLDDKRLQVWRTITVTGGVDGNTEELISGYITHVKPWFGADAAQCELDVWGMDASVLMDREDRLKDWPDKKDSDIATELFQQYGLDPQVDDTRVVHERAVSTVIQRETDIRFLKRLAARNGFECFVEGRKGYFRAPRLSDPPQPVLAVLFGAESNVEEFSIDVNGLSPANVAMAQVDRVSKDVLQSVASTREQISFGASDAKAMLRDDMQAGVVVLRESVATGSSELTALCQGLFHQLQWFVTGEGAISGNRYPVVLKPRRAVPIKGIGETYSGNYYVTHVTHVFTQAGYRQRFGVKRNALNPTGTEDFASTSDSFDASAKEVA